MTDEASKDIDEEEIEEEHVNERRKKYFTKELRCMMYGAGDDVNPYSESVDLLDEIVVNFICEMTRKAMATGPTERMTVEDLIYIVKKDNQMYSRIKELLTANEELKKARKAFDEVKYATK